MTGDTHVHSHARARGRGLRVVSAHGTPFLANVSTLPLLKHNSNALRPGLGKAHCRVGQRIDATMPKEDPVALRAGFIGTVEPSAAAALAELLPRLAALLPTGDAALRRFVCQDRHAADPAIVRATPGWSVHSIAGLAPPQLPPGMLALDGDVANPAAASHAAAGIVLRNCDVLVAAGDAGSSPLEDQMAQALSRGVPVMWLAPGAPPRLLLDRGWRVARDPAPEGEAAWQKLRLAMLKMLHPNTADATAAEAGLLTAKLASRPHWRTHRLVMEMLWRTPPTTTPAAPSAHWAELYGVADELANGYADRYRSSYIIVLALAAVALIAAVLGIWQRTPGPGLLVHSLDTAVPEALCLLGIIILVVANRRFDWRSRLILCRLLAELCRKQSALSFLGRSLPATQIAGLTQDSKLNWVGWRFAASIRATPLPTGVLAGPQLAQARDAAAAVLLRGERAYHAARAESGRRRGERLVLLGAAAFTITSICMVLKLLLLGMEYETGELFGLIAALLPAVAAAVFGLRAYAELDLLVQQSEHMITVLDEAARSLDQTDTDRPLASQHIGDVLEETAIAMLADVEGWIQISRVKIVEPG